MWMRKTRSWKTQIRSYTVKSWADETSLIKSQPISDAPFSEDFEGGDWDWLFPERALWIAGKMFQLDSLQSNQ